MRDIDYSAFEDKVLTPADYQSANFSQSACNLSGLVHSLDKLVTKIWEEARAHGQGTEFVNQHPIVRLFVEQLHHLNKAADPESYHKAYTICGERGGHVLTEVSTGG